MKTITLPQHAFKAVAYAMAKNDIRYYLNGLLLEHNGAETRMVATDGHRLNACIIEHFDTGIDAEGKQTAHKIPVVEPIQIILPRAMVETICKAKAPRHIKAPSIVILFDDVKHGFDEDGNPIITQPSKVAAALPDGTETVSALIDGRFPDYCRLIPESFSGETACYNPRYMVDAYDALSAWLQIKKGKSNGYGFSQNGSGVGGFSVPGFIAIVMPTRADVCQEIDSRFRSEIAKPEVLPEVCATTIREIAALIDPSGVLQNSGLVITPKTRRT